MLGGGRVLHKLKEELGGVLEYRRSEGVVVVYGQRSGPEKAAACVRTALILSDRAERSKVSEQKNLISFKFDLIGGKAALNP